MKHESWGAGKGTRGSEERQKRSGIGARVSERLEGAEIVGIRGKGGEKAILSQRSRNSTKDSAAMLLLGFEVRPL